MGGTFVAPGREKWPLVWVPLCFCPVLALFPHLSIQASYLLAVMAGVGFASMIPVTVALAQHLLPHRANFASSLMMGGAWVVATIGPRSAEFGVTHLGIETTFALVSRRAGHFRYCLLFVSRAQRADGGSLIERSNG